MTYLKTPIFYVYRDRVSRYCFVPAFIDIFTDTVVSPTREFGRLRGPLWTSVTSGGTVKTMRRKRERERD